MWAMIPMLRVLSRVNLRGMGRIFLCLLANVPDSGRKKRAWQARGNTSRTARGFGLCLEGLHEVGPGGRRAHLCCRPAAMSHGSSAFPSCAGRPLGFRAVSTRLRIALLALGAVLGGSRAATVAVLVLAVAALAIALAVDLPDVHETGLIGRTYDAAQAEPRAGLYLEIAGGCLALAGGALILLARPAARRRPRSRRTAAAR